MSTLHSIATQQYTEHYARMNPTLDARAMPERLYNNMEAMFGAYVRDLPEGSSVADLGCGTGFLLYWLARHRQLQLSGVDLCASQAALAANAVPSAHIVHGTIQEFLHDRPGAFQVLFCMDVLEHLETEAECFDVLRQIERALAPGGVFICRVPNAAHILGSYSRYIDITHHRSFTSHSLRQALNAAGFAEVRMIATQSTIWLGKLRLWLERGLHQALFLLGGYTQEREFHLNLIAEARKRS